MSSVQTLLSSNRSPGYPHSVQVGYKVQGFHIQRPPPSAISIICWVAYKTQKNATYVSSSILKDIIKDTDEQPVEDIHRARFMSPKYKSFCSSGVGVYCPPSTWICSVWGFTVQRDKTWRVYTSLNETNWKAKECPEHWASSEVSWLSEVGFLLQLKGLIQGVNLYMQAPVVVMYFTNSSPCTHSVLIKLTITAEKELGLRPFATKALWPPGLPFLLLRCWE